MPRWLEDRQLLLGVLMMVTFPQYAGKTLIAHRGASAYAPENTLPAYRLALRQGADYVEQDLQITKDGVLVCLHDLTLERTTDVAKVFPGRFRKEPGGTRRWYVSDFTLAEIKQLDAGAWFGEKFRGPGFRRGRKPSMRFAVRRACIRRPRPRRSMAAGDSRWSGW